MYHLEYIEYECKIMFIKILLNKIDFFTGFALFRRECRSAQMNEVRIIFFSTRSYMYHFEVIEFWRKIMFINQKSIFNWFALFWRDRGSAEVHKWMKWVFIFFTTRPYLYHFEYIEFGRKVLFVNREMNWKSKISEYPMCRMFSIKPTMPMPKYLRPDDRHKSPMAWWPPVGLRSVVRSPVQPDDRQYGLKTSVWHDKYGLMTAISALMAANWWLNLMIQLRRNAQNRCGLSPLLPFHRLWL